MKYLHYNVSKTELHEKNNHKISKSYHFIYWKTDNFLLTNCTVIIYNIYIKVFNTDG